MRTHQHLVRTLPLLLLASAAVAAAPGPQKAAQEPESVYAFRLVAVWSHPDAPPPELGYLLPLLNDPATLKAAADAVKIPEAARDRYKPSLRSINEDQASRTVEIVLELKLPADDPAVPPRAGPFLDHLIGQFRKWVAAPRDEALRNAMVEVERGRVEVEEWSDRLEQLRTQLRRASGRVDVSPEGIRAAVAGLEQERQRRELQVAASRARHAALKDAIQSATKRAETRLEGDEIARELEKAVEISQQALAYVRKLHESGAGASATDLAAAEMRLAEARVALYTRKEALAGHPEGGPAALVQQMEAEALNLVEAEAVLDHVKDSLKRLDDATRLLDEYESHLERRDQARRAAAEAEDRLRAARAGTAPGGARPPVVVVKQVSDTAPNPSQRREQPKP